jgi:tellurite resistance protein
VEELVAQLKRQPPVAEGRTEPAVAVAKEPTATEAEEDAPAEAGLVDITSILGAPAVTVVRSSL